MLSKLLRLFLYIWSIKVIILFLQSWSYFTKTKSLKCIMMFFIFFFFSSSVYSLDLKSYWDELDRLNGLRIYAKTGGWNFWYKNDTEYVY